MLISDLASCWWLVAFIIVAPTALYETWEMTWPMILLYAVLMGLPFAVVAFAFRSSERVASSLIVGQTWKPISFLGPRAVDDDVPLPHVTNVPNVPHSTRLHVIVLVHGWLGTPLEMGYLKQSLYQCIRRRHDDQELQLRSPSTKDILSKDPIAVSTLRHNETHCETQSFVIHSAECNSGPILTSDGIEAGGRRVAAEIDSLVAYYEKECSGRELKEITISLVGNSLGGLYARHAISQVKALSTGQGPSGAKVVPKFFVTTCTPHLGVSKNTYVKLPRWMETPIAHVMQQTGLDLFRKSDIIQDMTVNPRFLRPLLLFRQRIAVANVYGTDFQVPTPTAAFLADTQSIHEAINVGAETQSSHNIVMELQTPQKIDLSEDYSLGHRLSDEEVSMRLDQIGWTKILVDMRQHMPITGKFMGDNVPEEKDRLVVRSRWTARELLQEFDRGHFRHFPLGHTVAVANSKDALNRYLTHGGKAAMDYLADHIINGLEEA